MEWVLVVVCSTSAAWWFAQLVLFVRGRTRLSSVEALDPAPPAEGWPRLSVVMPARNEAAELEQALASKLASTYPNLELVLVNDRSTDETGAIAERFAQRDPRLRVVHLQELPEGWLGKVHAMARGFEACTGEFVLFSDADIHIAPGTLERVLADCQARALDFVTIFPSMRTRGLLLNVTLSTMFRVLLLFSRPWAVKDPRSSAAMGVGAFNLVRRSALAKTRGLEWLRLETGDDVALGAMLKKSRAECDVLLGGDAVSVEFYPSFVAAMRAVEKNGASAPIPVTAVGVLLLVLLELGVTAGFLLHGWFPALALAVVLTAPLLTFGCARWLRFPSRTSLLSQLGVLPLAFVMLRSVTLCLVRGGIVWRGTFYSTRVIAEGRRYFAGKL